MRHIWIDTDCGIDDALALLIAGFSPNVKLVGVSCTYGNNRRGNVEKNVHRTLNAICEGHRRAGRHWDPPVICRGPLDPVSSIAFQRSGKGERGVDCRDENWHGYDGLGDAKFSELFSPEEVAIIETVTLPVSEEPVPAIIERACKKAKEETGQRLIVLAIGPFTSLLELVHLRDQIDLAIMGASFVEAFRKNAKDPAILENLRKFENDPHQADLLDGNMAPCDMPHAEHNIGCDPVAAKVMFDTYEHITVIDWVLTLLASISLDDIDRLNSSSFVGRFHRCVGKHMEDMVRKHNGDYFPLCDPLAAMVCCYPDVETQVVKGRVDTCIANTDRFGQTVLHTDSHYTNTTLVLAVSNKKILDILEYTLSQ
ncbi:Uridine nucleosidase [Giardia muris]|uniref:Uridine nucleosidase n=1 Tax=Giardia muris TaxID=5742 RepID=A0A4Z1T876_GIAMU|nr:Uridine nucleosidase [Giardia muris]|eukprot:TNJ28789.1 Uridine nucleosidase [Giardia muris]